MSRAVQTPRAYLEHVAIRVADIHWYVSFFAEAFGMTMREVDGPLDDPRQYWTIGGVQLIQDPSVVPGEGQLAHLGLMCEDLDAAISAARARGATSSPRGHNWLLLPDGLCLELMQASRVAAVGQALAIDPRTEEGS